VSWLVHYFVRYSSGFEYALREEKRTG
jgi:hypothetical protein